MLRSRAAPLHKHAAARLCASARRSASSRPARPARAAAGDKEPLVWPTSPPSYSPTGAPDANKHFDVSGVVVTPAFRASRSFIAAKEEAAARGADGGPVRVLFLSEGNVCRSVLAEALFTRALAARKLEALVRCESKGTRDYNVGEAPEPAATAVAQELGAPLREDHSARLSDVAADVVLCDLLLTFDKFTAADVMREVSVYDTIDPGVNYAAKVRALTQFHAGRRRVDEIDDPLYGNTDPKGAESLAAVRAAAALIADSCEVLADELAELVAAGAGTGQALRAALAARLTRMAPVEWLKPPMLSKLK